MDQPSNDSTDKRDFGAQASQWQELYFSLRLYLQRFRHEGNIPHWRYARYVWGMNAKAEWDATAPPHTQPQCVALYGVPVITDRFVSFDGNTSHEVLHQLFSYSTNWNTSNIYAPYWTSKITTATTTDLVRNTSYVVIYTYSASGYPELLNTWSLTHQMPVEQSIQYLCRLKC